MSLLVIRLLKFFRPWALALLILISPQLAAGQSADKVPPLLKLLGLGDSPYSTVNPANPMSEEVLSLYGLFTWVGLGIFALVMVIFVVVVFRFREKRNPEATDIRGNVFLELCWTTLPIIILIIIAVPTIRLLFKVNEPPVKGDTGFRFAGNPTVEHDRVLDITVIGHQWWWEFEYNGWRVLDPQSGEVRTVPIDRITANEPYFPTGVPISLTITSEDVVHSLWLPRIAGKKDVVPGKLNNLVWFFPEEETFFGECALYCGASHSLMRFNAHVVSLNEFEQWLNWGRGELLTTSPAAERGKYYAQNCMACHTMNGMNDFIPREQRIKQGLANYEKLFAQYETEVAAWQAEVDQPADWVREFDNNPQKPHKPSIPRLYEGDYVTVAPDLTDFRFRPKILAGIKENNHDNLLAWIKNPPAIKPEVAGTPTVRMPVYENLFNDQIISDIIEFLMTAEYSESKMLNFSPARFAKSPNYNQTTTSE